MAYAIARAKSRQADEVSADDLLLGCLIAVSRFGIISAGPATIDLEALGIDWLRQPETAGNNGNSARKVSYSWPVVELLDRAALIAKADGATAVEIPHVLAAFAGQDIGVMGDLKRLNGFTSASWRAAIASLAAESRWTASPRVNDGPQAATPAAQGGPTPREYLSPEDAALELGVHVQTIRAYVRSGKLPALRLAGERAIRIKRQDLHKLLEPVQPD